MENKKKWWLAGGIAGSTLLIAVVLGNTTNFLGSFSPTTSEVDLTLDQNSSVVDLSGQNPRGTTNKNVPTSRNPRRHGGLQGDSDSSLNYTVTDVGIDGEYFFAEACRSGSTADTEGFILDFEVNNGPSGSHNNFSNSFISGESCQTTTSTQTVFEFGLTEGDDYILTFKIAASEDGMSGSEMYTALSNTEYYGTYDFEMPYQVSVENADISSDYETFTTEVCNTSGATSTTEVTFTTNSLSQTASVTVADGACDTASVNVADFGLIIPLSDYELTAEANGNETTTTYIIYPDVELASLTVNDQDIAVEVCALGTFGDELTVITFFVSGKIDTSIGITLPENNTCETFTAELTDEEFALIESGDDLQVSVQHPSGSGQELDSLNNNGYYTY
jgi:hypothetical protein